MYMLLLVRGPMVLLFRNVTNSCVCPSESHDYTARQWEAPSYGGSLTLARSSWLQWDFKMKAPVALLR